MLCSHWSVHNLRRDSLTFLNDACLLYVLKLTGTPRAAQYTRRTFISKGIMDTNIKLATQVTTSFMLITSTLAVIARGITKAVIVRSSSIDDYLIALSLVSTIDNLHCK